MTDLFETEQQFRPLADRMRPRQLDQVHGQAHLLGDDKPLRQAIESNKLHSPQSRHGFIFEQLWKVQQSWCNIPQPQRWIKNQVSALYHWL